MNNQKPVCSRCGSDEITRDAVARWNPHAHAWEMVATYDNADCEQCGGKCSIDMVDSQSSSLPRIDDTSVLSALVWAGRALDAARNVKVDHTTSYHIASLITNTLKEAQTR